MPSKWWNVERNAVLDGDTILLFKGLESDVFVGSRQVKYALVHWVFIAYFSVRNPRVQLV